MRTSAQDMSEKLNREIEELTEKYEKLIDEYEEEKIRELNKLRDDLKLKVEEAAEGKVDTIKIRKMKKDVQTENDIKIRQKKRELMKELKTEMEEYKKELTTDDYKEDYKVT